MMRKRLAANPAVWLMAAMMCFAAPRVFAQDQNGQSAPTKTPYTLAEYNAYQAAASQTNPQAKIQALDDFVNKFPKSVLMPLVDQLYYATYVQLKDYPDVIKYADKYLAFSDADILKIPGTSKDKLTGDRLQALYFRAVAFNQTFKPTDPNANDELTKARQAALEGLQLLNQIPKPANMTDEQFAQQKKPAAILFNYTAGNAAFQLKDYKDAIASFQADIAANGNAATPDVAAIYFRIGVAYLDMAAQQPAAQTPANPPNGAATTPPNGTPPANPAMGTQPATGTNPTSNPTTDMYMNGFWALARSIALKGPGEAQMRSYLRAQMFNYEQPACGSLLDQQMNELIQLAGTQADRPTSYSIPSAADLAKVLQGSNLLTIISNLQAGGDQAKMTWLAVCGQEIPDVYGKIIDIVPGTDLIDFKVFTAATGQEIAAGTTANLDVPVYTAAPPAGTNTTGTANAAGSATGATGQAAASTNPPPVQPEVARMQKGTAIKFTGTLVSYDTQPFMLHFANVKVDPSVIPPAPKGPARRPRRPRR